MSKETIRTTLEVLLEQRAQIRRGIIELASRGRPPKEASEFSAKASELLTELENTDRYIESARSGKGSGINSSDFSKEKNAIDPIMVFLEKINRPATQEEIVDAVISGGFRGGEDTPLSRGIIKRSLSNHITGTGKHSKKIKMVGDLYGLYEWSHSRFQ
jgi:hypothetical protein